MAFGIELDWKKIKVDKRFIIQALYIGIWVTFIEFLLASTGIGFILNYIPPLLEKLFVVGVSIYLARILVVKSDGREVI